MMMAGVGLRQRPWYRAGTERGAGGSRYGPTPTRRFSKGVYASAETPKEAIQRRLRESQRVEERVIRIHDDQEFEKEVLDSDDALVVVEVSSDEVCDTGIEEQPELQWKYDQQHERDQLNEICSQIKHVFQRTARECKDVKFVSLDPDTQNGAGLCDTLGIDTIPTLQFYKGGELLWEHKGALYLQQDLGEGVLYYANTYAGGADAGDFVFQIRNREDFESFTNADQNDQELKVIDVSVEKAEPCLRIYPAVLALAKNFKGYVSFARLLADEPELELLGRELEIIDVPTFLFFKQGKEVKRYASSSRADLIGQILSLQGMDGLPQPKSNRATRRPRAKQGQKNNN